MPDYFNVNSSQANAEFQRISANLSSLERDYATATGSNEGGITAGPSPRAAQNGTKRLPWIMSTTEWLLENPPKGLAWEANPSDISWSMPQRATHTKTLIGTVLHVWPNVGRNTFFDEFRITLNLQSGNLIPIVIVNGTSKKLIPSGGISNFYDFMQLVDAPKLTVGNSTQPPRANMVSIQYSSKLFPRITLLGMFDPSGMKFTDTSQDNQVTGWSIDFVVYDTIPKIATFNGQLKNPIISAWDALLEARPSKELENAFKEKNSGTAAGLGSMTA